MLVRDKIAVISGASSGIGAATARRLATLGAHVVLVARNRERLTAVAAEISAAGGRATPFPLDLAAPGAIEAAAADIERAAGPPDILVHAAGAGRWLPLLDTGGEEARQMIELPYLAAFNLTRAILPGMVARRRGHVACITSPGSFLAWPGACGYIAARHALKGFADALRLEAAASGVAVSLIVLGRVDSPYWDHNPGSLERVPRLPRLLARTLTVEEAAAAVVAGIQGDRRMVVRPAFYRALIVLNTLAPRLVERQMRRAAKAARRRP